MQPQQRLTEQERADLVAFVDGELPDEEARRLEAKVSASVSARKEVEELEKTWAMLDWLPTLELPPDFATQTVSLIHSRQLRAEHIESRVKLVSRRVVQAIGWAASLALAASIGFVALRHVWPDPAREFIEDLEIVENLDAYRVVPDIKFLQDIARLREFAEPAEPLADPAEAAAEQPESPAASAK